MTGPLMRRAFFQAVALKRIYTDKVKPYNGPDLLSEHEAILPSVKPIGLWAWTSSFQRMVPEAGRMLQ